MRQAAALTVTGILVLLLALLVGWGLLTESSDEGSSDAVRPANGTGAGAPSLRGAARVESRAEVATERSPPGVPERVERIERATHRIEVLDYLNRPVSGASVFLEVDLLDPLPALEHGGWKTLATGTTAADGVARLSAPADRPRKVGEGLNRRLRIVPPSGRHDLAPTWRLWTPVSRDTYRLVQTHVLAGRVVDAEGEPVWAATVWVGDLPTRGIVVNSPGWRKTTTDVDGYFRFAGIPTKADWRVEVWAVGPGEKPPASSAEIRNPLSVELGDRKVLIKLE